LRIAAVSRKTRIQEDTVVRKTDELSESNASESEELFRGKRGANRTESGVINGEFAGKHRARLLNSD
jgi:hypothetical protein